MTTECKMRFTIPATLLLETSKPTGARLAICDEAPDDAVLDEEAVKRATAEPKA